MGVIRIATRKSPLALWQAEHVAALIAQRHPQTITELVPLSTKGDEILDKSLAKIGGKGLFIKELEVAMYNGLADIAVHSIKDLPAEMAAQMMIGAILSREEPSDALVGATLDALPTGAIVGTSSLRRQAQLLSHRPDLQIQPLRGNVGTRLSKLDAGNFNAIVLAHAGLIRLGLEERVTEVFDHRICLPAVGQGAIAIECHEDNQAAIDILKTLNDADTEACITAERAVTTQLEGTCTSPIAAYATLNNGIITLRARVASPDGRRLLETLSTDTKTQASQIGSRAANSLIDLGALSILGTTDEQ